MKPKKTITENQYYQLIGLCTASIDLEQKRDLLADSWAEIVGEENRDRFWDFYEPSDLRELEKKLKFDGIVVKRTRKTKQGVGQ
jgi:hypothetical protein